MSAWPLIVDRLLVLLPTLPGWSQVAVYDGPPVTADAPTSFVTVGFVLDEDNAGSFEPLPTLGDLDEESGSVVSEIVCTTGDVDLPSVRARAFALFDAWKDAIERDPTLGVLSQSSTTSLTVDVRPAQTTSGAVQRLAVTLGYLARS